MPKIAVAMSGGVDSSVAAALMVEKYGKENVFGITMRLFCYGENEGGDKACCSLDAVTDAKLVCDQIGIPHYIVNLEKEFERDVIENFTLEYSEGRTPNPCIRCNQLIKYEHLYQKAKTLGADILATGHYARIYKDKLGYHLLKGLDVKKDQSYFLYNLDQNQMEHIEFPIGELEKTETRSLARQFGLKTAQKTESQDICFVTTTVPEFLSKRLTFTPGNIVDKSGKILGKHQGLIFYTIGQRKGLGGGFPQLMYVTGLNKKSNEVTIGPENELYQDTLRVEMPHWLLNEPNFPYFCTAKIRYQAMEAECNVEKCDGGIVVNFLEPQKAITPGQSIVFYQDDEVIGGGLIH